MKRTLIISLHAGYWLVYLFLTLSTLIVAGSNFKGNIYASVGLNAFLAVTCFYTFYFVLVPKFLAHRKIGKFVVMALLTSFLSTVIMMVVQVLPTRQETHTASSLAPNDNFPIIFNWMMVVAFHMVIGTVHGLLASFMKGFFLWYDDIQIKQQLEKRNMETQMSLIKARIDPHFLFNTLNNIDVLIKNEPASASIYLQQLCNIMRFTLYQNHSEFIPLQKEIEIMKQYIELERIRSTKNFISVEVTGDLQEISIAPMVLLPFIENAFKHSEGRKIENGITVKVALTGDSSINFFCRNVIAKKPTPAKGGIGMELIMNRLSLLYPNKHALVFGEKDNYFEVKLTISTR
jgi:two-component system, LytTR family, sensor kinase